MTTYEQLEKAVNEFYSYNGIEPETAWELEVKAWRTYAMFLEERLVDHLPPVFAVLGSFEKAKALVAQKLG